MSSLTLERVVPQAGVRGGRVQIYTSGLEVQTLEACRLVFGVNLTRPTLITPTFLLGTVPEKATPNTVRILQHGRYSNPVPFTVATLLADNLHPVANPAVDHNGNIYSTISGTKGQQVPVSVFKITRFGDVEPFASGIMNPTGLAFGPDGALYVSSRHEGMIYRVSQHGIVSPFAEGLGMATGLAFDPQGRLYVGDRRGTIYQISVTGKVQILAKLGPSIASYHLAYGSDGQLYVSYPTLSGDDRLYRIAPDGAVHIIAQGLGRAQGLAFDLEHNLYVVAYMEGTGGVIKMTPEGHLQHVVVGINLVGLAFGTSGELFLTDHSAVYKLNLGIRGRPLPK